MSPYSASPAALGVVPVTEKQGNCHVTSTHEYKLVVPPRPLPGSSDHVHLVLQGECIEPVAAV